MVPNIFSQQLFYFTVTREVGFDGSVKETERTTTVWPEPGQVPEAPLGFKATPDTLTKSQDPPGFNDLKAFFENQTKGQEGPSETPKAIIKKSNESKIFMDGSLKACKVQDSPRLATSTVNSDNVLGPSRLIVYNPLTENRDESQTLHGKLKVKKRLALPENPPKKPEKVQLSLDVPKPFKLAKVQDSPKFEVPINTTSKGKATPDTFVFKPSKLRLDTPKVNVDEKPSNNQDCSTLNSADDSSILKLNTPRTLIEKPGSSSVKTCKALTAKMQNIFEYKSMSGSQVSCEAPRPSSVKTCKTLTEKPSPSTKNDTQDLSEDLFSKQNNIPVTFSKTPGSSKENTSKTLTANPSSSTKLSKKKSAVNQVSNFLAPQMYPENRSKSKASNDHRALTSSSGGKKVTKKSTHRVPQGQLNQNGEEEQFAIICICSFLVGACLSFLFFA